MTTGVPLYLVSACASGEEFVAAFRRYADRNGVLFVPTAEPLTSGKRGRIAVTLKDGGVMIEGDAEVVSSSKTPSVLYGRTGMTVKFTGPDELSKVVLGELEKARLALKPAAPSVLPRPAELPGDKRPTPPPTGGRIDAVNALAECVILGELPDAVPAAAGSPGSGKFAVPQILPLGARPKSPTAPPSASASGRTKKLTQPPVVAPIHPPEESGRAKSASIPPPIPGLPGLPNTKATSLGMPALRTPAASTPPTPARGFPSTPPATIHGLSQTTRAPAAPVVAPPPPIIETPTAIDTIPTPPGFDINETLRGTLPAPPIVASARTALADVEIGEPTDLSAMPSMLEGAPTEQSDAQDEPRTTNVGVAVAPPRPLVIEEPTPSGDWTMTPGENGPTITRVPRPEAPIPKGPPTGDWMIALDPSRPDGWSEPSKVEKRPPGELPPGPPLSTISSDKPLDSNANVTHAPAVTQTGPSIEIDPSLTGLPPALTDVAAVHAAGSLPKGPFVAPLLTPTNTPAVQLTPEEHMAMLGLAQPAPRQLTDAGTGFFRDSGEIPRYATEPSPRGRRKHVVVIAVSAAAVLIIGLVLVFTLGGGKPTDNTPAPTGSAAPAPAPAPAPAAAPAPTPALASTPEPAMGSAAPNAANVAIETPPAPTPAPEPTPTPAPPEVAATPSGECEVKVSSSPAGAEIFVARASVGKTPTAITLPCGVETKLSLRHARYVNANVTVKPSADKPKPVKVALARVSMTVKVSSVPSGATITVGSKSMGVTPTTVKLPAFEASTLKISKPGFTDETHKVTPKQNNVSVHAVLKKTASKKR